MLESISMEEFLDIRGTEERKEGRAEERERINMLNKRLKEDGRIDDLLNSIDDKQLQDHLLAEFNL